MLRKILVALGVAAFAGLSLQMGGTAEAAVTNVTASQACAESGVGTDVTLGWSGASPAATQTWVDVSLYNNGWIPGTYSTSGAISPNISSFKFVSLLPNNLYYVRVSQLLSTGVWDSSTTFQFMTAAACTGMSTSYSSPSYSTSGGYGSSSSEPIFFSMQPIDYWVRYALAAMHFPPRAPIYVNCYPPPFIAGCHFP
jgi:hypothetical protein